MKKNHHIEAKLNRAQCEQRCAFPQNRNEAHAMHIRFQAGELLRVYPRCYIYESYWKTLTPRQQTQHVVRTVSLYSPKSVFAGPSALAMFEDIDYPYNIHKSNELYLATTHGSSTVQSSQRILHYIHIPRIIVHTIGGVKTTPLNQTIVNCTSLCSFAQLLPIYDWAKRKQYDVQMLKDIAIADPKTILKRDDLIRYADARSENGGESFARGVMLELGFCAPQLQQLFTNPNMPEMPLRVDFLWTRYDGKIIVAEYDGLAKYGTERSAVKRFVQHERSRDDILRSQGVAEIIHFNFEDLIHPQRLQKLLLDAGVPRRW